MTSILKYVRWAPADAAKTKFQARYPARCFTMISGLPTRMVMSVTVGLVTLQAGPAAAEDLSTATTDHRSPEYPDVVKLKNGGFVRGTIAELIPNGSVTIVTVAGETERFAMSQAAAVQPTRQQCPMLGHRHARARPCRMRGIARVSTVGD